MMFTPGPSPRRRRALALIATSAVIIAAAGWGYLQSTRAPRSPGLSPPSNRTLMATLNPVTRGWRHQLQRRRHANHITSQPHPAVR